VGPSHWILGILSLALLGIFLAFVNSKVQHFFLQDALEGYITFMGGAFERLAATRM
jgi:hypothetical protein